MILQYPHEKLLKQSVPMEKEHCDIFIPHFKTLIEKYRDRALGLAAPQTGLNYCMIWTRKGGIMINPVIIGKEDKVGSMESCLSIEFNPPKLFAVERYKKIKVMYRDENFKLRIKAFSGIDAFVIQHECDHLDGKTLYQTGKEVDIVNKESDSGQKD